MRAKLPSSEKHRRALYSLARERVTARRIQRAAVNVIFSLSESLGASRANKQHSDVIFRALQAVATRLSAVRYHTLEFRRRDFAIREKILLSESPVADYIFLLHEEPEVITSTSGLEAHVLAAVHASHGSAELLSECICKAFPMNSKLAKISKHRRSLNAIVKADPLENVVALNNSLRELWDSKSFDYVRAFSNLCKHRDLVRVSPKCLVSQAEKRGERDFAKVNFPLESFDYSYDGAMEHYPQKTLAELTDDLYATGWLTVCVATALCCHLRQVA